MAFCECHAVDSGCEAVRFYTHELMVENIEIYKKPGYQETHRATEDGCIKLNTSVQTEATTLVSLVDGAMLATRACGNATLFKDVTDCAIERLKKSRKTTRSG